KWVVSFAVTVSEVDCVICCDSNCEVVMCLQEMYDNEMGCVTTSCVTNSNNQIFCWLYNSLMAIKGSVSDNCVNAKIMACYNATEGIV
ncbi:hypothetical protein BgiBS90_000130, partial [Biomphalaria glabrata]